MANWGQANKVWLNNGSGNFSDSGLTLGGLNSWGVSLGDVDGDGDLDAFVANWGQANKVWLNNGSGNFSDSGLSLDTSNSDGVSLGDVDGDGDLDAFVTNYNSQPNKVWLNVPTSVTVTPLTPSVTAGQTRQFTAMGIRSDASTSDITSIVTWTSSDTAVATIGVNTGLATSLVVGTALITAASGNVSGNTTITVTAVVPRRRGRAAPPPAPAPAPEVIEPGVVDVSAVVQTDGEFTQDVNVDSADGLLSISIEAGNVGTIPDGSAISRITVTEVVDPPPPPTDASVIGLTYDIDAGDATFENPVTITLVYDPENLPTGVNEEDLTLALWDEVAEEWVIVPTVVDPVTNTITAEITHFSKYAIISLEPEKPAVEEPEKPAVEEPEKAAVEEPEKAAVEEPEAEKPAVQEPVKPAPVEPEPGGLPLWAWLLFAVGGVSVIGAVVWLLRRRTT